MAETIMPTDVRHIIGRVSNEMTNGRYGGPPRPYFVIRESSHDEWLRYYETEHRHPPSAQYLINAREVFRYYYAVSFD